MVTIPPFINILWKLVNDRKTDSSIRWSETSPGCFEIPIPQQLEILMPFYFKHAKFASFTRQLNLYGFERAKKSPQTWCHRLFQPGRPDLLSGLRRASKTGEVSPSFNGLKSPKNGDYNSQTEYLPSDAYEKIGENEIQILQVKKELEIAKNRINSLQNLMNNFLDLFASKFNFFPDTETMESKQIIRNPQNTEKRAFPKSHQKTDFRFVRNHPQIKRTINPPPPPPLQPLQTLPTLQNLPQLMTTKTKPISKKEPHQKIQSPYSDADIKAIKKMIKPPSKTNSKIERKTKTAKENSVDLRRENKNSQLMAPMNKTAPILIKTKRPNSAIRLKRNNSDESLRQNKFPFPSLKSPFNSFDLKAEKIKKKDLPNLSAVRVLIVELLNRLHSIYSEGSMGGFNPERLNGLGCWIADWSEQSGLRAPGMYSGKARPWGLLLYGTCD